jgi:hypothetical protein
VHFRGNEVDGFHQVIARHRAEGGRQSGCGCLIGNVLEHDARFGQQAAIVQFQCRDVAFGIDHGEVGAVLGFLGSEIDLFQRERQSGFPQRDVRCQRTGAGAVIEFHLISFQVN